MTKKVSAEMFQPLTINSSNLQDGALPKYHIYSDRKSFVTVEAINAQAALEKSGIKQPYRIEYDAVILKTIISSLPDSFDAAEKLETIEPVASPLAPKALA